jgi:uncharacterized iron-regulated membrane protein
MTFMKVMLKLHTDLFAGLPGELFLGLMGLLFVIAIVSGVVLYAPFMRKLAFGTIRAHRINRVKWLDVHNLLGIATLTWAGAVGVTGIINELSTPLFALWRATEVRDVLAPYQGKPGPQMLVRVQAIVDRVNDVLPDKTIFSIVYPNPTFGSPYHYIVWVKGKSALTSRLFTPVLINAETGKITTISQLPLYLKTLEISRPLHFGDFAGLPLKVIWAIFDLITIVILGSGIYLWIAKHKEPLR